MPKLPLVFSGKNVDLQRLVDRIHLFLQQDQFTVAESKVPEGNMTKIQVQAIKSDLLKTLAGQRRSTDIIIEGEPNNFQVTVSEGQWGKNLISTVPLAVVGSMLGASAFGGIAKSAGELEEGALAAAAVVGLIDITRKLYQAKKFDDTLRKFISATVDFLVNTAVQPTKPSPAPIPQKDSLEYPCDYVEGYPGWKIQVPGGKLVLERYHDGSENRVLFVSSSDSITMTADHIEEAHLIIKPTNTGKDDLMIQLRCKSPKGLLINPVFNIADDIIQGVVSGISELIADDKVLVPNPQTATATAQPAVGVKKFCYVCGNPLSGGNFCPFCGTKQ